MNAEIKVTLHIKCYRGNLQKLQLQHAVSVSSKQNHFDIVAKRLPSRIWNHWTSPWTKQLTWLRIVHSGEWRLRLALRTH